ncbi:arylsulfatase [Winogradskyella aurantiaca]|uniref:arylsulfatase n=1 Tax=Winogradskyella aurantiaca TaxID=2219558 RepID=UPI000E1D294C|nr:arylsulfatase [Winogradskyella aurantiaca]
MKLIFQNKFNCHVLLALFMFITGNLCAQGERPNVVIMLADNMGYGDLGVYGGGEIRGMPTPNIDQIAKEGLQLTQFFVEPGCTPSRAALMTGRYSTRSGLNSIIVAGTPSTLQDGELTMAEMFKSKGYDTGMVGKWHLGQEQQSLPTNQGFDEYHVGILETTDGTLYPDTMRRSGLPEEFIQNAQPYIWESQDGTDELVKVRAYDLEYRRQIEKDIADASVKYIEKQAKSKTPFFLYVGWSHVHYPGLSHLDFVGKSSSGPYGDMVMELDYRTGQIMNAIKDAGIENNTIVIWISDNGPVQSQGTNGDFMGSSAGPWRGEIGDALEGSLRVPGIIKWPNRIKPSVSNGMVSIHDLMPSLAAVIGADIPEDRVIDGVNQMGLFTGENKSARESLITFIDGEVAAVRWKHWRIYPRQFTNSDGTPSQYGIGGYRVDGMGYPAIYNIKQDPREQWNQVGFVAWVIAPYLKTVTEYYKTLQEYPNPKPLSMTKFGN